MRGPPQVCGNRGKSTAPASYSRLGGITTSQLYPGGWKEAFINFFIFREEATKKQGVGAGKKEKPVESNPRMQMNGKNLIEVQPSPSPEN